MADPVPELDGGMACVILALVRSPQSRRLTRAGGLQKRAGWFAGEGRPQKQEFEVEK